jgi:hypothetical protein
LQQVGVCNVKTYEDYNDYGDHLPVWANFKLTTPIVFVQPRKLLSAHKRCDIGSITEAVRKNEEGENWDELVIYNKLIMEQIARFPKHTLQNHERCVSALLCVSVKTVEYGKGLCKKKKSKQCGRAHQVQLKRKNGLSTASTIISAHIKYYTNLSSLAFPPGRGDFNPK